MRPDLSKNTVYDIMACPVCNETISANVSVAITLGMPKVSSANSGSAEVETVCRMTSFNVTHQCVGTAAEKMPEVSP